MAMLKQSVMWEQLSYCFLLPGMLFFFVVVVTSFYEFSPYIKRLYHITCFVCLQQMKW